MDISVITPNLPPNQLCLETQMKQKNLEGITTMSIRRIEPFFSEIRAGSGGGYLFSFFERFEKYGCQEVCFDGRRQNSRKFIKSIKLINLGADAVFEFVKDSCVVFVPKTTFFISVKEKQGVKFRK